MNCNWIHKQKPDRTVLAHAQYIATYLHKKFYNYYSLIFVCTCVKTFDIFIQFGGSCNLQTPSRFVSDLLYLCTSTSHLCIQVQESKMSWLGKLALSYSIENQKSALFALYKMRNVIIFKN